MWALAAPSIGPRLAGRRRGRHVTPAESPCPGSQQDPHVLIALHPESLCDLRSAETVSICSEHGSALVFEQRGGALFAGDIACEGRCAGTAGADEVGERNGIQAGLSILHDAYNTRAVKREVPGGFEAFFH